ncbi:hypothetical protein Sa4125_20450 [Aureimonas sp. SA4125]|nr:hypothetical protein Sa4125_20450 [Aureimonas sp. SA4125]
MAARGAGAAGWPTASEITLSPRAIIRFASDKTSMARNGSTAERAEVLTVMIFDTVILLERRILRHRACRMPHGAGQAGIASHLPD